MKTKINRKYRGLVPMVAICIVLLCPVSPNGQIPNEEVASSKAIVSGNYRIGPGDVIDVAVSQAPTLSRTGIRVNQTGTIQLPMLDGEVFAACLTERELADVIAERQKKYLVAPHVIVSVLEFNSKPVALLGAVNTPGRFQLQRSLKLLELLTFVNGPNANAGRTIEIIRSGGSPYCDGPKFIWPTEGTDELISIDLEATLKGNDQANPYVRAGDIIRVTASEQINAYILGNVRSSMAISLKDPVSLVQAVAMAGGLSSDADSQKVKIRRQIPNSLGRTELLVNLKAINQGKADDILLQANDIIDVPGPTGSRKFLQTILRTIVPTITQLPMRVVP